MSINNVTVANIETDDCKNIEESARSAAEIALHNFMWHYITLVLVKSPTNCGLNVFLQAYNKIKVVSSEKFVPRLSANTKQFVLFGQNLINIVNLLECIQFHGLDNTGRFLIICESNDKEDCDKDEAVKILWEHKIVNVIFINNILDYGTVGYTYEFGENCKNTPAEKVRNWDLCIRGDHEFCRKMFPIKFLNLYGCPIIVSTFIQEPYMYIHNGIPAGADGDILRIIIEALNATLLITEPFRGSGWGYLDENGTWVGSFGDLYYNLADFSMTSASVTDKRYRDFQMSNFYYTIALVWITHPPEMEKSYYKLLRPFKLDAQIAIAISFLVLVIIVLIFKTSFCMYIFKKMKIGRMPDKFLFSSWEICMGMPIASFPSKMALSYLVLMWIWYCFLMRTFYQVHLINSLKNDIYLGDVMTIEEGISADYPFGGGSALKDFYIDQPIVYENWKHMDSDDYPLIMLNLTNGMKFILAMNLATAKFFLREPGRKLHILPQHIVSCPTVIFFKKFSYLAVPINRILERLVEFGWTDMAFKNSTSTKSGQLENEDKPIKLSNFTGCYVILWCGWIASFFMLIFEMNYMKK